jgi:ribonuclease HII
MVGLRRRSARLHALLGSSGSDDDITHPQQQVVLPTSRKRQKKQKQTQPSCKAETTTTIIITPVDNDNSHPEASKKKTKSKKANAMARNNSNSNDEGVVHDAGGGGGGCCLPRTQENKLKKGQLQLQVFGIDEAGRGPLAGPVVAAAIIASCNVAGVFDSKKITKEEDREELYEKLVASPNVRWAVAVVDAARIDEINILQATLQAMRMAAKALLDPPPIDHLECAKEASVTQTGCYVVCSSSETTASGVIDGSNAFALIDGNRLPKDMPCGADFIIKGDSKEFCIAAASILAKVTRDRLMHGYDKLYPQFNLKQHKGYPTAAHMAAVREHGASPIHRRTFAPLKHMEFDEDGRVLR